MSSSNINNDYIKNRANNLKSTVKVLEQSLENDKQRREKISKEVLSLNQYCDKILKEINTEKNECINTEIMIGYLESCEKCKVSESESNFSFSQSNPLKFTEIELIGLLLSKRSSMRTTPLELLVLKPNEFLISLCDNYILPGLNKELVNPIKKLFQNNNNNISNNIHIYVSEDEIDPFIPICPFELNGECTDIGCPFQHLAKTKTQKEEIKETKNEKEKNISKFPLIVIPIPKNYNFKLNRKYRIEALNSQIPLYLKTYYKSNESNLQNIFKEILQEMNSLNNNNLNSYIIPDSLQPELLLKYIFKLSTIINKSNNMYDLFKTLKSFPNSIVLIDYILQYISQILQSHRTVYYVWNLYLNLYFLRQWTNVQGILFIIIIK